MLKPISTMVSATVMLETGAGNDLRISTYAAAMVSHKDKLRTAAKMKSARLSMTSRPSRKVRILSFTFSPAECEATPTMRPLTEATSDPARRTPATKTSRKTVSAAMV